ncbi:MAG: hypothetical protein Ct9H300mP1_13820 [Planctomycetaceae bacterium]|nr:MAG: hypothetical protein Ct9H300mP1_13820 [Planctomycetaceae bacterium]
MIWGGVQELDFDFTPLITSGSRPLLVQGWGLPPTVRAQYRPGRSNFTDTPDWPILISNLLEECRDSRPGLRRVNYRVTEDVRFRVGERAAEGDELLRLEGANRTRQVARGRLVEIPGWLGRGLHRARRRPPTGTLCCQLPGRRRINARTLVAGDRRQ